MTCGKNGNKIALWKQLYCDSQRENLLICEFIQKFEFVVKSRKYKLTFCQKVFRRCKIPSQIYPKRIRNTFHCFKIFIKTTPLPHRLSPGSPT